jgi:hypothetical protein
VADTISPGTLDARTGEAAMLLHRFGGGPWARVTWQAGRMAKPLDYYLHAVREPPISHEAEPLRYLSSEITPNY